MQNATPKEYLEGIWENHNLSPEEKIRMIKDAYGNYNKKLEKDLRNYLVKKWAGAALEIGSAAIPFGGAGRLGASAGRNLLQKTLGRKLSQEIGSGAASGLASGAVFGAGRGLIEDKNSLITGLHDAAGGLAAGGLIGGAGGYLEKAVRANMLENSKPISELTKTQIKNLVKQGKEYYWDYLQWRNLTSPQLGKINFPGTQAGEIRVHNMKMIPKIPEQIRSAQGLRYSNDKPWRNDANNFYKLYNTYKGKNYEYVIRNNANKTGNDFYQIKEVDSGSAYLYHNQALEPESNNIINDISKKVNPAPMIIPPQILQNLQEDNQPSLLLEGGVEMNIDQNGNHIFTPEEIGQMNSDDFSANESAIMKQLQSGLIGRQIKNFANFTNPITGDGRIFSREDIGQMSGDEYSANESAIIAQLKSIGIPTGGELEASSIFGGGTVYVRPYTREDGTEVRGYWRSAPSV